MHAYTALQIVVTVVIFIVTLTKGAPAFPVIIIALVPLRLLLMNRIWNKKTLRFVDEWACRDGAPEDIGEGEVVVPREKPATSPADGKELEEATAPV